MFQFDYNIDNFMSDCQLRDLRPKTMQSYEQSLRIFEKYMVEVQHVTEAAAVKEEHIKEYIQYLRNRGKYTVVANEQSRKSNTPQNRPDLNKPISEITINNYLRNMKVFFNYLFENHYIKKNPFSRIKKKLTNEHKAVDFISDEDFRNLIHCFDKSKFFEYRDCTITELIMDTGMRIGETLLIKLSDVDMVCNGILNL